MQRPFLAFLFGALVLSLFTIAGEARLYSTDGITRATGHSSGSSGSSDSSGSSGDSGAGSISESSSGDDEEAAARRRKRREEKEKEEATKGSGGSGASEQAEEADPEASDEGEAPATAASGEESTGVSPAPAGNPITTLFECPTCKFVSDQAGQCPKCRVPLAAMKP